LGLEVHGLGHTPFAWVRVPQGCTSAGFAQRLLDECKLLVVPGTAFGSEGEGFVRLSIFADEGQIEEAVSRISRAL
ncbi:MAG: aminotransferase class I/II-fold pyridoxal phosphate-dependent enzyme, partial [Planctomycetota bacterium]|nr:aminotransferase class I/II-fold pyridoxal phosphate-dependent enzyme [Planctomycetota bacterium]